MEIRIPVKARDEEEYRTKQKKATYSNIREYVKEHYGIWINSNYIAQVKRSCGLDMRENHNKSKKENPVPMPICPDDKAQYIKEALVYFGVAI